MNSLVFIALQAYQLVATLLICSYAHKYKHSLCEIRDGPRGAAEASSGEESAGSEVTS